MKKLLAWIIVGAYFATVLVMFTAFAGGRSPDSTLILAATFAVVGTVALVGYAILGRLDAIRLAIVDSAHSLKETKAGTSTEAKS
jgi:hypothetical protein